MREDDNAEERLSSIGFGNLLSYAHLMKPELTGLSVLTTLCGYYLSSPGSPDPTRFALVALATLLIGGGLGALNQYVERHYDALMKRTERRPIPDGRVRPVTALLFGSILLLSGIFLMAYAANLLAAAIGVLIAGTYLLLYTPLKRISVWSTLAGGIPGALPPLMGWAAGRGEISSGGWVLFAILFLWQMPHFYALAWMYRKDYARAGFNILTVSDERATQTSRQIMFYSWILIPVSTSMTLAGVTGWTYSIAALSLGVAFLICSFSMYRYSGASGNFSMVKLNQYSRQLFFASLWYLPALMALMIFDKR